MLRAQSSNQCAKQEPRHGQTMVVARRRGDRTNQAASQRRPAVGSSTIYPQLPYRQHPPAPRSQEQPLYEILPKLPWVTSAPTSRRWLVGG